LLGVRLEGLIPAGEVVEQLELGVEDPRPGWREAQGAVDRAVARFGSTAVRPAALLQHPKKPISSHHEDESAGDLGSR
jgi:DNA polymerase-4